MLELTRSVRLQIPLGPFDEAALVAAQKDNTYAGWPAPAELCAAFDVRVTCRGNPDPQTGYLIGIADVDAAVRDAVLPLLARHIQDRCGGHPALLLRMTAAPLIARLPVPLARLELFWSPWTGVMLEAPTMNDSYTLRQQFDFAASHRLFLSQWSEEQNREVFGHCARRHGHNYRVEVTASASFGDPGQPPRFSIPDLDAAVSGTLLEALDHRDLNEDLAAFADRLPSVENIARYCFGLVEPAIAARHGRLESVEVWETEKTSCRWSR